jgi:hypothetical protein
MMRYFGVPLQTDEVRESLDGVTGRYLCFDVLEARRADKREADKEDVGLRIRQRPKTVVVFLTGSVPKSERNCLAIDHHIGRIIVKD